MMAIQTKATSPETDFTFDSATHTITGYVGSGGDVDIPPTISGVSVEHIGNSTFLNQTTVTSVTIPDSVTSIEYDAFFNCTALKSITIPNSVTSIEDLAFYNCTALENITIPGITTINAGVFAGCKALQSIIIPNSVTSMVDAAFVSCTALNSATFKGNAPTHWEDHVFDHAARDFKVYYYSENSGFTLPTFHDYPCVPLYQVNVAGTSDGIISASTERATVGSIINLTVSPNLGSSLYSLYYTDNSGKHTITNNSFLMPANDVTIYSNFTSSFVYVFFAFSFIFLFGLLSYALWFIFRNK